ncbi:aspirochlorine biosynthesis protein N [Physcia stellaris]|nr:aspirochlorine biosynthesis protein N [Physcia stellaris]
MSSAFEDYFRFHASTHPEITSQDLWKMLNILPSVNYVDDAMLYNNTSFDDNLTYHVDSDGNWQATHVNTTFGQNSVNIDSNTATNAENYQSNERRSRGRPKGSKNRPKSTLTSHSGTRLSARIVKSQAVKTEKCREKLQLLKRNY